LPSALPIRPIDATLSVTKAARLLGVHPNTIRAWSDAGRLRYYRINPRGDRRYRLGDLQRFLAAAENTPDIGPTGQAGQGSPHSRRGLDRDGMTIPTPPSRRPQHPRGSDAHCRRPRPA
jgi:excisionase family DNA binding protein